MLGQGFSVAFERFGVTRVDAGGLLLGGMEDKGRLVLDSWRRAQMLDQLREQTVREAFPARLLDSLPDALNLAPVRQDIENAVEIDAVVPDVQGAHRSVVDPAFAVGAHRVRRRLRGLAVGQSEMLGGDDNARGQPLDVPLPWRRQCFVEIVDVEKDVALRRGEPAEIHQVSVAAGLHAKPGHCGRSQVSRHDGGRPAIEGERRL